MDQENSVFFTSQGFSFTNRMSSRKNSYPNLGYGLARKYFYSMANFVLIALSEQAS